MSFAIDLVLLAVVLLAAIRGWRLGASVVLARLAGLVLGVLVGLRVADALGDGRLSPVAHVLLAAVVVALGAMVGAWFGRWLGHRAAVLLAVIRVRILDQLAGAALRGFLAAAVATVVLALSAGLASPSWAAAVRGSAVAAALDPVRVAATRLGTGLLHDAPADLAALVPASADTTPSAAEVDRVARDAASAVAEVESSGCPTGTQGTAFAVSSSLFVTNAHVVRGATQVTVQTVDGQDHTASVVAYAPRPDLAVLAVDGADVTPLALAAADAANGTGAVVIGYPDGTRTVTAASIVQRMPTPDPGFADGLALHQAYLLHAAVRHGNSGSPLLDLDGRVVGVVNALSVTTATDGYATTVSELRAVLRDVTAGSTPVPTGTCATQEGHR